LPATTTTTTDPFFGRLAASIALGLALLIGAYAIYFAVMRAPQLEIILADFAMTPPEITRIAMQYPWVPLAVALGALAFGFAAFATARRSWLIIAYVVTFLAAGACVTFEIAVRWPLDSLLKSIASTPSSP